MNFPEPYLELLKRHLTGELVFSLLPQVGVPLKTQEMTSIERSLFKRLVRHSDRAICRVISPSDSDTATGRTRDHRLDVGLTMVGRKRLDNVEHCLREVLKNDVPGDFIETGVWRGGVLALARAVLNCHGATDRRVFGADSFRGLPTPNTEQYPDDEGLNLYLDSSLAISRKYVEHALKDLDLWDGVVLVEGWFRETLPTLTGHEWCVIRLDGDLYESTRQGLDHLYPNLQPGGVVIVDDYHAYGACKSAVDQYRTHHSIETSLIEIDGTGVYWVKE